MGGSTMRRWVWVCAVLGALGLNSFAQQVPGSSSSSSTPGSVQEETRAPARPRATTQSEAGGSAVTLETSEALFEVAVALNACGYDNDLANSAPVRAEIRAEIDRATIETPAVKRTREALCGYIHEHELMDRGRSIAQYISLALYLSPPPQLAPTVEQTEMPPDALNVVNVLPLLRDFADAVVLNAVWQKHRPEYEAATGAIHDRVVRMVLDTSVYLHMPVSAYDDRRFLVLLEPMLAPSEPNGRIYANDYILVNSPTARGDVRMDQIRHIYLQYTIDPLMYGRASSMIRLQPLLKPVQEAPLDFAYRSDITMYLTECLIKGIEARTMEVGFAKPVKPVTRDRVALAQYDAEMAAYGRSAEEVRRRQVDLDMRQGWGLTEYFYEKLGIEEHDGISLKDNIAEMVYGMDVPREESVEEHIAYLPKTAGVGGDFVRREPKPITGMMLAEKKMLEGDLDGAREIATRALADPKQDHAEANYVMARVQLMEGEPSTSVETFAEVLRTSNNPHTLAWTHIYLGRLYDTLPDRPKAVAQYKAALGVAGVTPDAKFAAEDGLKQAYKLPSTVHKDVPEDDGPLDPSGKAEKDSYKPE
jgi:tetratricopeptide (TPR) repeat protein